MASSPLVYIVILNYKGAQVTLDCVRSVLKIDYPNFRVLVVDNASPDDSVALFKTALGGTPVEVLISNKNEGYAGGNNLGIEKALAAGADYIFVLNNDTLVEAGCLQPLVEAVERDMAIGIASCPIFNTHRDYAVDVGYRMSLYTGMPAQWRNGAMPRETTEVHAVCGAAMFLRAATIRRIGAFDPRFFLVCEDTDICFRARKAGFKTCFVPGPGIQHLESYTTGQYRPKSLYCGIRNRAWFIRRYGNAAQRLIFKVLCFSFFYPRAILGGIVRRQFHLLGPMIRGMWEGHWRYPGP